MLIKWITCRVLDRAAFDRGQRSWSTLKGEPGFHSQGGGWSRDDPDLAHVFACWSDRPAYDHGMARQHDRLAAAQSGTYRLVRSRLFDHRLPIGLGVPLDFTEAALARIAHCHVRPGRRTHFRTAQATVWNPGMAAAPGLRHGSFAEHDAAEHDAAEHDAAEHDAAEHDAAEFLVLTLWRSPADHDRYRADRFHALHHRSAAADDLASVSGDAVRMEPAWTVTPGGSSGTSFPRRETPTVDRMTEDITLNNGVTMPALGLGVFQSPAEETAAAVETALTVGYRHIDTAAAYGNERQVGEGIRRSGLDRGDVFIETKVWVSDYGYDETRHAFDKAARKLGVDRLDLFILHQPAPDRFDRTVAAYQALEKLLADGQVRAIGVSNFMRHHLSDLLGRTEIVPAVNQIELHPYFSQPDVRKADDEHRILTQAWSPIGGITFYPGYGDDRRSVLTDATIAAIAAGHDRSPAQVMLRWQLQHGRSAIPKSTNPARIAENFDVFGFQLSDEEMARIDALDTGVRSGPDPDVPRPAMFDRPVPED